MVRRIPAGIAVSMLLWIGLAVGVYGFARAHSHSAAASRTAALASHASFSHVYPPDPVGYERPAVGTTSPIVAAANRVQTGHTLTSVVQLAMALPRGALRQTRPGTWLLTQPVELPAATALVLQGPLVLDFGPGSFIVAEQGGRLDFTGVTVSGVTAAGAPALSPAPSRGFIDARDGAIATMQNDTFSYLGHLGDQSYGLTLNGIRPPTISHCTFSHDYFGLYLARLAGGSIVDNNVVDSVIYGIDPHTNDTNLLISGNHISGSGVHGIILADHASHNRVVYNTITTSRDHGLLVYQYSDNNVIEHNHITSTFDGIVVQDSSGNHISDNTVSAVTRFALRISGLSSHNVFVHNALSGAMVGVYVYQGPAYNSIVGTIFTHDYENVRIRSDATAITVTPRPARSEL